MNRSFLVTTGQSPEGIVYHYTNDGLLYGIDIKQKDMPEQNRQNVLNQAHILLDNFLAWATHITKKGKAEIVELEMKISFEMFWNKYDDKLRSSKKKTEKIWNKLTEPNQIKAYYYINTYNRNRGTAEKKYAETYLNAELWNN